MSSVNLFSNRPKFCQKPTSFAETFNLNHFNALVEANPDTCSWAACGDPNLGTLWRKNVLHKVIRCGGSAIDLNELEDLFPYLGQAEQRQNSVGSLEWYNHYVCDIDFNIYASAPVTAPGPGQPLQFLLLKSNHASSGSSSFALPGYQLLDKENSIQYTVTAVDTTIPYAHKITIVPNEAGVTGSIKANKGYLILPAREIGGCHCALVGNEANTIGYTQRVQTIGVRKDWRICIDVLSGYKDMPQFAVTYDYQGNPVDNWMLQQEMTMRQGIRMTLNAIAFLGTPTTNSALINTGGAIGVDDNHMGFYGLIPTLKYAGGNVYNFRQDLGFDFQADGEPIFLYQDSLKRSKEMLILHGQAWRFATNDRTNGLVSRTAVGELNWNAYERLGETRGEDYATAVAKLGVKRYTYDGFDLDMKKMESWSDRRYMGNDYLSNMGIFMPKVGTKENGQEISPLEFNTFGQGQWNGNYQEYFIDYRKLENGCNDLGGWASQYTALTVHCPGQWILANPVKAA